MQKNPAALQSLLERRSTAPLSDEIMQVAGKRRLLCARRLAAADPVYKGI